MRRFWDAHFMQLEAGAMVLLGIGFTVWSECGAGWPAVDEALRGNRSEIYSTLAAIAGSLLGFVLTAVSIVLGFSAFPQLAVLRSSEHYATLYRIFFEATGFLAGATVAGLAALVFDRDSYPRPLVLYLALTFTLLSAVRVARCVWVLERFVELLVTRRPTNASGKKEP